MPLDAPVEVESAKIESGERGKLPVRMMTGAAAISISTIGG